MYAGRRAIILCMYRAVACYSLDGAFLGYAIKGDDAIKLQSTNLYGEDEQQALAQRLADLNGRDAIVAHWPDARDPDVQKLVDNPAFEPVEMVEQEAIDEENSYMVWKQEPVIDEETGIPTGEHVPGPNLDMEASVLVYKTIVAAKYQSAVAERTKKAQETVARQRLQIAA